MSLPTITKDQYKELVRRAAECVPSGKRMEFVVFPFAITVYLLSLVFLSISPWGLLLAVPCTGLAMLWLSVIQHECAHRTLFQAKLTNDLIGFACSLLTFLPHKSFLRGHRAHHRFIGNPNHKDPTESKPIPDALWLRLILKVRFLPVLFFVGVFFPYFFYDYFPTATRRKISNMFATTFVLSVIFLFHFCVGSYLGLQTYYWMFLVLSFLVFGILYEHLFTQNQHAGLQPAPNQEVYRFREQGNFSRSVEMPLANWFFYFNLHKEHHLFPQVNYRVLPDLHVWIESECKDVAEFTSSDLGWIRRRNYRDLFELKSGDGMKGFDWICENAITRLPDEACFKSLPAFLQHCVAKSDAYSMIGLHGEEEIKWKVSDLLRFTEQLKYWLPQLNLQAEATVAIVRPPGESEFMAAALTFGLVSHGIHVAVVDANVTNLELVLRNQILDSILVVNGHSDRTQTITQQAFIDRVQKQAKASKTSIIPVHDFDSFRSNSSVRGFTDDAAIPNGNLILFSSGSTDRPKMARFPIQSMLKSALSFEESGNFEKGMRGDTICFSFAHTTGIRSVIHSIWNGSTALLIPREMLQSNSLDAIDAVVNHPPSHVTAAPGLLAKIVKLAKTFPVVESIVNNLQCINSIGAEYVDSLPKSFDQKIENTFGMTETQQILSTLVQSFQCRISETEPELKKLESTPLLSSGGKPLGYPMAGVSVGVRFEDRVRKIGELFVKTELGCDLTKTNDEPDWFATGDRVQLCDNQIFYVSRINDRLVANGFGENFSMQSLESRFKEMTGHQLVCFDGGVQEGIVGLVFVDDELQVPLEQINQWVDELNKETKKASSRHNKPSVSIQKISVVEEPCPLTPIGKVDQTRIIQEHLQLIRAMQNNLQQQSISNVAN